jgi:hypothetical protein
MKTWSDRPISVVESYSILQLGLLVIIKSMHELSFPRLNVSQAGGPGCSPFKIVQPYCSQIPISHGARWFVDLSVLILAVCISSSCGARLAILVFQSPHITVVSPAGKQPTVSSTRLFAIASSTPRLLWLIVGGK